MKRFILGAVIFLVAFLCTGKVSMAKENAVVDLGPPVTTTEEGVDSSSGLADTSETDITAGLLPDVNTDSFFQRLYKKIRSMLTGTQMIVAIVLIALFCIETVLVIVAAIGNKQKVPWFLVAMGLTALMFVCNLYAVQITSAFASWFMS